MHTPPIFDGSWKLRAQQGDAAALDQLVDAVLEPLFHFCLYRVGRNRHLCEEVVQETLIRAITDLSSYQPQRSGNQIFPWLTGLARNEIRRTRSRELATTSLESSWARMDEELRDALTRLESSPLDQAVLECDETFAMVDATMLKLPAHYRETLEAKYVSRRSVRQIACDQGTSVKAVESVLSRARQAFRETFLALARDLHTEKTWL